MTKYCARIDVLFEADNDTVAEAQAEKQIQRLLIQGETPSDLLHVELLEVFPLASGVTWEH